MYLKEAYSILHKLSSDCMYLKEAYSILHKLSSDTIIAPFP